MKSRVVIPVCAIMLLTLFSCQGQTQREKDVFERYKTFTQVDLTSKELFYRVFYKDGKVDKSNFDLAPVYTENANQFNSNWENERINLRTQKNKAYGRLLSINSEYLLLDNEKANLESELQQLEDNLLQQRELKSNYLQNRDILEKLKEKIIDNYTYYGIFYAEFNLPNEEQKLDTLPASIFKDYGEKLIKDIIQRYYITAIVEDKIWGGNNLEVTKELITDVEMLNIGSSFHISLPLSSNPSVYKHIVVSSALFKNEGTNQFGEDDFVNWEEEEAYFKILSQADPTPKSSPIFRSFASGEDSIVFDLLRTNGIGLKSFSTWYRNAKERLTAIDTKDSKRKWIEDLQNFSQRSLKIEQERQSIDNRIGELEAQIVKKEQEIAVQKGRIKEEENRWNSLYPQYLTYREKYYQKVATQKYYDELIATNPNVTESGGDSYFAAVYSKVQAVKVERKRELIKTVRRDVSGKIVSNKQTYQSLIKIKRMAILGSEKKQADSKTTVEIKMGVEMQMIIPEAYIRKEPLPSPPWEKLTFIDPGEKNYVVDKTAGKEWRRIRLTKDEDTYGNEYRDLDELTSDITREGWRLPDIIELKKFGNSIAKAEDKLDQYGMRTDNEIPFWSTTPSSSKNLGRIKKRCLLIVDGEIKVVDREITEAGYYLFVRDVERKD